MTDLIIINPGGGDRIYQSLDDEFTAIEPPLWCRLIAGYVRDRGYSVEIVDMAAGQQVIGEASLYCIAAYGHQPNASTQSMEDAGRIARYLKERYPDKPVIMVGGHVAALPEQTLREFSVDYVCAGDGPVSVLETLEVILGLGGLPRGVMWNAPAGIQWAGKDEGEPCKARLADINELHGNTWDLLPPMDRYRAHLWQVLDGSPRSPYASIYTSLQCPYGCVFCPINAPFGGRGYRTRRPKDVVHEVDLLRRHHNVTTFKIIDEMFVLKPSHYVPICEKLAELRYADELNIWAYARVDTVKPDTLALMRRAGIRWLALGIESGSAYVRDGADKKLDDNDIVQTVRAIQAAGINVIGNFIFGLSDDTWESMEQTVNLAEELNCEFANFYSAMAYPGSALYDMTPKEHLPKTWSGYSQHSVDCTPLPTDTLTAAEVLATRDATFHAYFTNDRYLEMLDKKFGTNAVDQIKRMTSIKLERNLLK